MRDAFVSYATRDARPAFEICAALRTLGLDLWLDEEERLRSRSSWREAVHEGIASSRTMLVAFSPHWAESPACRYELAIATERRTPLVAMFLPSREPGDPPALTPPAGAELIDGGDLPRTVSLVASRLARRAQPREHAAVPGTYE